MGWPGKVHNASVYGNSSLSRKGQSGARFPNVMERFAGADLPLVSFGGCGIFTTAMFDETIP